MNETPETPPEELGQEDQHHAPETCYTIQFRPGAQLFSAVSRIRDLKVDELVMAQTEHGLEPAIINARTIPCPKTKNSPASWNGNGRPLLSAPASSPPMACP